MSEDHAVTLARLEEFAKGTQKQLSSLDKYIRDTFAGLSEKIIDFRERLVVVETCQMHCQPLLIEYSARLDKLEKSMPDEAKDRIKNIEDAITGLKPWLQVLSVIGTAVLLAIIALIWGLLTGTVHIVS